MKYLPILQELFESDIIIFVLIGFAAALFFVLRAGSKGKRVMHLVIYLAIYIICEIICNAASSYLLEFIALFAGAVALGGTLGSLAGIVVSRFRKKK